MTKTGLSFRNVLPGIALLAPALLWAAPANAAIVVFNSRAQFNAAASPTTVEDFTDIARGGILAGVLNSSTTTNGLVPGDIDPGVTYSVPTPGQGEDFALFIDAGGGFTGGFLDGFDYGGDNFLNVTFDSAQGAFGFDTNNFMGAFTIVINSSAGPIFSQTFPGALDDGLVFFGFQSDSADIVSLTIESTLAPFGNAFAIDNFTFNGRPVIELGGIPEPATWAMMITGFGMAGGALRRHKRSATAAASALA